MDMKKTVLLVFAAGLAVGVRASWYWPFGPDEPEGDAKRPRLSELMEPASLLIDEASDLAEDGKSVEAVEKYREALAALDAIEAENREWADKPEFATLRNKRAYVNATIDSLLLMQVKSNARAVAVSDTTALERKLAEEKAKKAGKKAEPAAGAKGVKKPSAEAETPAAEKKADEAEKAAGKKVAAKKAGEAKTAAAKKPAARPKTRRAQAMADLAAGDLAAADLVISEMLAEKPDDAAALNLKAVLETARGNFKAAERALDRAISVHPRSHYAYYNMANLILRAHPANKSGARRYYETGRSVGGPRDAALETRLSGLARPE